MDQVGPSVVAVKKMSVAVEEELRSLLLYFGEQPDSPDTAKPEDFFALIQSFSSSLQVSKRPSMSKLSLTVRDRNVRWRSMTRMLHDILHHRRNSL